MFYKNSFYEDMVTFVIVETAMLFCLLIYALYKHQWSIKKFIVGWKASEGNTRILQSILKILMITVFAGFIVSGFNSFIKSADASEIKWFDGGGVFTGLDYTYNISPFCEEKGINNRLNSNIGTWQNIVRYKKDVSLNFKYTHHSCAVNKDLRGYDTLFGFEARWVIW